jgi:DNA-binding XRE family transcriptional regulator
VPRKANHYRVGVGVGVGVDVGPRVGEAVGVGEVGAGVTVAPENI